MSIWGYRVTGKLMAIGVLVVLVVAAAVAATVPAPPQREVVLVARGMAFYLADDPGSPNPTIVLERGERVRVVLRNDDRGMTHDFAVPEFRAALPAINWNEEDDVIVQAPAAPGEYDYYCRPHMLMMRGKIVVR